MSLTLGWKTVELCLRSSDTIPIDPLASYKQMKRKVGKWASTHIANLPEAVQRGGERRARLVEDVVWASRKIPYAIIVVLLLVQ